MLVLSKDVSRILLSLDSRYYYIQENLIEVDPTHKGKMHMYENFTSTTFNVELNVKGTHSLIGSRMVVCYIETIYQGSNQKRNS